MFLAAVWNKLLLLIKVSRPQFWVMPPLAFCIGLSYGRFGLAYSGFQFTPLIILQMLLLSFPFCLFAFGINDIYDYESDKISPRKKTVFQLSSTIEGIKLEKKDHQFIKKTAAFITFLLLFVSILTKNLLNIFYTITLLLFVYTYSTPPWRLKVRPPLDSTSAGIFCSLAPFALGFSFVDNALNIPLQIYLLTFCMMGLHSFSTIMDYEVDKKCGDTTFAVVYGKRWASFFPAIFLSLTIFFINEKIYKIYCALCIILFIFITIFPSEKYARFAFILIFLSVIIVSLIWLVPFLI